MWPFRPTFGIFALSPRGQSLSCQGKRENCPSKGVIKICSKRKSTGSNLFEAFFIPFPACQENRPGPDIDTDNVLSIFGTTENQLRRELTNFA